MPLDSIEVEVHADYDGNAIFGLDRTKPPGWGTVRYIVRIESAASESDVQRVLDHADELSPLLDDFARALDVKREVHVTAPAK